MIVLAVLVALAPMLLGTVAGASFIAGQASKRLVGRVEIKSLSLSWTGGQAVSGLSVYDPQDRRVLHVDQVNVPGLSLLDLIKGKRDVGSVSVVRPAVVLVRCDDGRFTLQEALSANKREPAIRDDEEDEESLDTASVPWRADINIDDGSMTLHLPDGESAQVWGLEVSAAVDTSGSYKVAATADLAYGHAVGNLTADVAVNNVSNGDADVTGDVTVRGLPVAVVDELAKAGGFLNAVVRGPIDGRVRVSGRLSNPDAKIELTSTNLTVDLAVKVDLGMPTLADGASVVVHVMPEAWNDVFKLLKKPSPATLMERVTVTIATSQDVQVDSNAKDSLKQLALATTIRISDVIVRSEDERIGVVSLRGSEGTIAFSGPDNALIAEFQTVARQRRGEAPPNDGQMTAYARLDNVINADGVFDLRGTDITIEAAITDLPLAVIDEWSPTSVRLATLVGEAISVDVRGELRIAKTTGESFVGGLTGSVSGSVRAERLDGQLQATMSGDPPASEAGFDPSIAGTVALRGVPIDMVDELLSARGIIAQLIGGALDVAVELSGSLSAPVAAVSLSSANLTGASTIRIKDGMPMPDAGAEVLLRVTPESWAGVFERLGESAPGTLVQPVTLTLTIGRIEAPHANAPTPQLRQLLASAKLQMTDLIVQSSDLHVARVSLHESVGTLAWHGVDGRLDANFTALARQKVGDATSREGKIALTANVTNLLGDDGGVDISRVASAFTAAISDLPLVVVDELSSSQWHLVLLVGETASINLQGDVRTDQRQAESLIDRITGSIRGTVEADRLDGNFQAVVTKDGVLIIKDTSANWRGLDRFFELLRTDDPADGQAVQIRETAAVDMNVTRMTVPIAALREGRFDEVAVNAAVTCARIDIVTPENAGQHGATAKDSETIITDLRASVESAQSGNRIEARITANVKYPDGDGVKPIDSRTMATRLFDDEHRLSIKTARFETVTRGDRFPMALAKALTGDRLEMVALMGRYADVNVSGTFSPAESGLVNIVVTSPISEVRVPAQLGETLTLREDAVAILGVTPELSAVLVRKINPIINAVGGEDPIRVTVYAKDTEVPLLAEKFAFNKVKARARVEFNTLELNAGGPLTVLLRALRRPQYARSKASFTPLEIAVSDGVVSYDKMWMTIEQLTLGFRGRVDVANDRVYLDVIIPGKTFATVSKDFAKIIGHDYQFTIPMRGTIQNPTLALDMLVGEIARLSAKAAIRRNLGGREGDIAEQLLDRVLGGGTQGMPAPSQDTPQEKAQEQDKEQGNAPPAESQAKDQAEPEHKDPLVDLLERLQKERQEKKRKKRERKKRRREQREKETQQKEAEGK
jgi:hypothetical protein